VDDRVGSPGLREHPRDERLAARGLADVLAARHGGAVADAEFSALSIIVGFDDNTRDFEASAAPPSRCRRPIGGGCE
jgi:hypothetical protein